MEFRAGQRVKCVSPNNGLEAGKIYTVSHYSKCEGMVYLKEVGGGGRYASRFELFDDGGRKLIVSVLERQRDTTNSYQEQQDAIKALQALEEL